MSELNSIIAVDLMGGDDLPESRWLAVKRFLQQHPQPIIQLYAERSVIERLELGAGCLSERLSIIESSDSVQMDETPMSALREKRQSSLSQAIQALSEHQAQAVLTAGNTGALVALAKYWLKGNEVLGRPALATLLPGSPKPTILLDVGATLEYQADDLYALAELGADLAPRLLSCGDLPEIALLNVGTEHIKGHDRVQQADRLLQRSDLNYVGFCEGSHLFSGFADVVCCDGFVGNVALKACEGLLQHLHRQQQSPSGWRKWLMPKQGAVNFNPAQYNGALLLGLDGLVVKAHGNSDQAGFYHALERTFQFMQQAKS